MQVILTCIELSEWSSFVFIGRMSSDPTGIKSILREQRLLKTAAVKVKRIALMEQILPSLINYTLEQGAHITRRQFHDTTS